MSYNWKEPSSFCSPVLYISSVVEKTLLAYIIQIDKYTASNIYSTVPISMRTWHLSCSSSDVCLNDEQFEDVGISEMAPRNATWMSLTGMQKQWCDKLFHLVLHRWERERCQARSDYVLVVSHQIEAAHLSPSSAFGSWSGVYSCPVGISQQKNKIGSKTEKISDFKSLVQVKI